MRDNVRVAVIGAGVTGLCAAHYLSDEHGPDAVLVLEASNVPGGKTLTDHAGGYHLDWGPNGFLDREPATLDWLRDIGLIEERVQADEAAAHRYIFRKGRLHEVVGPPKFLLSPLLSPSGRARLLLEPFMKAKAHHEGESIWGFAARRIGSEAADVMVSAMVTGIYGGDAKELSLEHCFPRMAAMEARYGSLFKALQAKKKQDPGASPMGPRGALTSFSEGIGRLPQHAADRLGAAIQYERRAQRIRREDGGFVIEAEGGETVRAEAVVIAAPAYAAGPMVSALDEACSRALSDIPYAGLAVLCTGYRRDQVEHRLDGFGFLVPRIEGLRALGCLWTSSIFPSQAPKDGVLLRTMFGGATDPAAVELSQDELLALLKQEVHPLLGISGEPELVRTFHQPRGIPQYVIGHGERLAAIEAAEEALPGLVFAGNAYRGIGLNECVVSALRAVKRVRERLSGGSR